MREIGVSIEIKKVNSLFNQHLVSTAFLAKAVLFNKKMDYFFVGVPVTTSLTYDYRFGEVKSIKTPNLQTSSKNLNSRP
jgi:hypothetical protein